MPENKAPVSMPHRSHHAAPRFDGKAPSLSLFLDDVEYLAETCGLSQNERIKWTIRYSPSVDRELWEMQESVDTGDWEKFKEELYDLYPGSKGEERRYSTANLQALIDKQKSITIRNPEDYGMYQRSFLKISSYLSNKSRLSNREISQYFLCGLESSLRHEIQAQLKAQNPRHHPDDPYELKEVTVAALFLLSCDHSEIREEKPSISTKTDLSHEKYDLIINAARTNSRPNMELQEFTERKVIGKLEQITERKEEKMEKRMDKYQDIRSKKEPEVSGLKKSDSISERQHHYVTPIHKKFIPDSTIAMPVTFQDHEDVQPKILAIEIQKSSHVIEPIPISKDNVLVLTNSSQETSKNYDTSILQLFPTPQDVEQLATPSEEGLPSEAASRLITPSPPMSRSPVKFLHQPEVPCNAEIPQETNPGTRKFQEENYLTQPEKDNPTKIKGLSQDKKDYFTDSSTISQENRFILTNHALQDVELPAKTAEALLPSEAALPLPSQHVPHIPSIAEYPYMPESPRNSEKPPEMVPRTTNHQKRQYLSAGKGARPEKDKPGTRLSDDQLNSRPTGIKDRSLFNKFSKLENMSTRECESNTLKFSRVLANFNRTNKSTRRQIYSRSYLHPQKRGNLSLTGITVEHSKSSWTIKQCAEPLISNARRSMIKLFLESNQKILARQIQDLTIFQAQPLIDEKLNSQSTRSEDNKSFKLFDKYLDLNNVSTNGYKSILWRNLIVPINFHRFNKPLHDTSSRTHLQNRYTLSQKAMPSKNNKFPLKNKQFVNLLISIACYCMISLILDSDQIKFARQFQDLTSFQAQPLSPTQHIIPTKFNRFDYPTHDAKSRIHLQNKYTIFQNAVAFKKSSTPLAIKQCTKSSKVEFLYMPKSPRTPEKPPEDVPGTNSQKRQYLSAEKGARFLWPEKDNPAARLIDEQRNSRSTVVKKNKKFFKKYFEPSLSDIPTRRYNSILFKTSSVLANFSQFNKTTRDKLHSRIRLHIRKRPDLFLQAVTFKLSRKPFTIKQSQESLISKARYNMTRLFLESNQKKLARQLQIITSFISQPLSSIMPNLIPTHSYRLIRDTHDTNSRIHLQNKSMPTHNAVAFKISGVPSMIKQNVKSLISRARYRVISLFWIRT